MNMKKVMVIGDSYVEWGKGKWPGLVGIPKENCFSHGSSTATDWLLGKYQEEFAVINRPEWDLVIISIGGVGMVQALRAGDSVGFLNEYGRMTLLYRKIEAAGKRLGCFTYSPAAWPGITGLVLAGAVNGAILGACGQISGCLKTVIKLEKITKKGDYNKGDIHLNSQGHKKVAAAIKAAFGKV